MLSSIGSVTQTVRKRVPFSTRVFGDETRFAYKLIVPALAMMLIVHFIPIVWGFVISFMKFNAAYISHWLDAPFIGLEHYRQVVDPGSQFWFALRQTILFGFGSTVGIYLLGLVTALLLNMDFRGRLAARTVVLMPYLAPAVCTIFIWRMMLSSKTGIVNSVLMTVGLIDEPMFWLIGPNQIYSIIIVNVWIYFPFAAIMLYAGLQSIPEQLYEAADIDGAGRWAKFRYITFPQLKPVTTVIVLLMVVWSFINFTIPYLLLGQQPGKYGEVLMLYIYNIAFNSWSFGLGAALSAILFIIAMVFSYVYYRKTISADFQGGAI